MGATPFKLIIRPAPEIPPLPPGTPKPVIDAVEQMRRWCREIERSFRAIETEINTGKSVALRSPDGGTWLASISNAGAVTWTRQ